MGGLSGALGAARRENHSVRCSFWVREPFVNMCSFLFVRAFVRDLTGPGTCSRTPSVRERSFVFVRPGTDLCAPPAPPPASLAVSDSFVTGTDLSLCLSALPNPRIACRSVR